MSDSNAKNLDLDLANHFGEREGTLELLKNEYSVDTADITSSESLTFVILDYTVNGMYDRAIKEVKSYLNYKSSFPTYRERTERLFDHIIDVINAIRTKKNLGTAPNIPVTKRKELNQVISFHFQDLKKSLQRVTQIEYNMRLRDSRSTLLVINTFIFCSIFLVLFALAREFYFNMRAPVEVALNDSTNWIFRMFGL